jgi:hypothetical protein
MRWSWPPTPVKISHRRCEIFLCRSIRKEEGPHSPAVAHRESVLAREGPLQVVRDPLDEGVPDAARPIQDPLQFLAAGWGVIEVEVRIPRDEGNPFRGKRATCSNRWGTTSWARRSCTSSARAWSGGIPQGRPGTSRDPRERRVPERLRMVPEQGLSLRMAGPLSFIWPRKKPAISRG